MPVYAPPAVERAMKLVEIITRAMSGQITWIQARWGRLGRATRADTRPIERKTPRIGTCARRRAVPDAPARMYSGAGG